MQTIDRLPTLRRPCGDGRSIDDSPISRTSERFLQYAQNMRAVTWKNAGRPGADNGQYTCGFSRDRPMFPAKFMQKSGSSSVIAFCRAVLSFEPDLWCGALDLLR
jgi:hypothetical protein